jgi:hypothetical protein
LGYPDGTPGRALGPREAQIEIPLANGARYLPLGPLAEELHRPEKVRAAVAGIGLRETTKRMGDQR